ncbi:MAG: hypothetical protein AMXMBFR80_26370 [Dehalococcoidia bacterium]|jgi:hypothetical protein
MVPGIRRKRLVEKRVTVPGNLARACEEFNRGLFYECHETLEEIWQQEHGPVRDLYKGLIQVAAAFVHITRGNYAGAERLCRTALGYLAPYRGSGALGFDVDRIASDVEDAHGRIIALGPGRIQEFDLSRRPVYAFDAGALTGEAVRWRAWGFDAAGNAETKTIIVAE